METPRLAREMRVSVLDPLCDPRWRELIAWHPDASVFHTPEWLLALRRAYAYQPLVYTTAGPSEPLQDGVLFCRVRSWLTGSRLVSVPFADYCQPLLPTSPVAASLAWRALMARAAREMGKYLEIRPMAALPLQEDARWQPVARYFWHLLDISRPSEVLFPTLDKSCVQRRIHRAEREKLEYSAGNSPALIADFFALQVHTRRRHGLPPQPRAWFLHLAECFGDALKVHVARRAGKPIAAIITLLFRRRLTYKYGASDAAFHNLGSMPFLFWRAIQDGQRLGAVEFDLGRSETDNPGLIAFKENWAGAGSQLTYYRIPVRSSSSVVGPWLTRKIKSGFSRLPEPLLVAAGRWLYPHIG